MVLNENIILEIINVANCILNNTNNNDILLFVGQSSNYFYHIANFSERKCFQIPFSGRIDEFTRSRDYYENNRILYSNYLLKIGITRNIKSNIILIDHSHTGESIRTVSEILNFHFNRLSGTCILHKFRFINLISPLQYTDGWIKNPNNKYISCIGNIIIPNLLAFANEGSLTSDKIKLSRTIPLYRLDLWKFEPKWKDDLLVEGYNNILELVNYYKEQKYEDKLKTINVSFRYEIKYMKYY